MFNKNLLIIPIISLLITSCASATGPRFNATQVSPNQNLFVYREDSIFHQGTPCDFYVDDYKVGVLKDGGFISQTVTPGYHAVSVGCSQYVMGTASKHLPISVVKGGKQFVKFDLSRRFTGKDAALTVVGLGLAVFTGIGFIKMSDTVELKLIPSNRALRDMQSLRRSV